MDKILIDFLESKFLHVLYALRKTPRFFIFKNNFHQLCCFIGQQVCRAFHVLCFVPHDLSGFSILSINKMQIIKYIHTMDILLTIVIFSQCIQAHFTNKKTGAQKKMITYARTVSQKKSYLNFDVSVSKLYSCHYSKHCASQSILWCKTVNKCYKKWSGYGMPKEHRSLRESVPNG